MVGGGAAVAWIMRTKKHLLEPSSAPGTESVAELAQLAQEKLAGLGLSSIDRALTENLSSNLLKPPNEVICIDSCSTGSSLRYADTVAHTIEGVIRWHHKGPVIFDVESAGPQYSTPDSVPIFMSAVYNVQGANCEGLELSHFILLPQCWNGVVSQNLSQGSSDMIPPTDSLDSMLIKTLLAVNETILECAAQCVADPAALAAVIFSLQAALASTSVLLCAYRPELQQLTMACVGDCRALLGHCSGARAFEAQALSVNQTSNNSHEVAQNTGEHPDEATLFTDGRLFDRTTTRTFGGLSWKWPYQAQQNIHERFGGREPVKIGPTPPYVTAESTISTT